MIRQELERIQSVLSLPASYDIFSGRAGILLFHLKAGSYTADMLSGMFDIPSPEYFTLYTGATGLIYLALQLDQPEKAKALALQFKQGILDGVIQDDFISGHAGNIFVLTALYAETKDPEIHDLIRLLTDKLVQHARIAPAGLKWGHIKKSYDCLTGFSHGAAGIAYALLRAAVCLHDDNLRYLAEEAWAYEMCYYDEDVNNWLDLRLTSTDILEGDMMEWNITTFRKYISDINSWAHGAAGTGLSRLYAWEVTQAPHYLAEVELALDRCIKDTITFERGDFTLCSGYGGIAMFFLHAAHVLNRPALKAHAYRIGIHAIRHYQQQGTYNSLIPHSINDHGLFSGMAGVGYLLASLLEDDITESVVYPAIKHHGTPLYPPDTIRPLIAGRYVTPSLTDLWRHHKGWLYYQKRGEILAAKASQLPDDILMHVFVLVPHVVLCPQTHHLHKAHEEGITTYPIQPFAYQLLQAFTPHTTLNDIIHSFITQHPHLPSEKLTTTILQQTKLFIQSGFIVSHT